VRLDSAITSLLTNLNRSSENLNALMDEDNRRAVKRALADLESGLGNAARIMEKTARLSGELPQLAQRMQRSADAFDHMTNELAHAATSASGTLDGAQQFTSSTLPELHQLVSELRDLTGSLRRLSGELEQNPSAVIYGKPAAKRGPGE
jgi:phospholipid/cholesterol/gamma-HCH transport system substrate-binding protein